MNIDYNVLFPVSQFPDRGTKWLLESPENVYALVTIFEPTLAKNIDFDLLEKEPTSFIPDNLREQESDLVFLAPFHDVESETEREVIIYILIEHQSTSDRVMTFRMLFYMMMIWDAQRREWLDKEAPKEPLSFRPILPIVFYTGADSWNKLRSMSELMNLPKALERFVPDIDILFMSLKAKEREELISTDHPFGWILQVIQSQLPPPKGGGLG